MKVAAQNMASLPTSTKQEMLNLMNRFKREKFHPHVSAEEINPSEMNAVLCIYIARERGIDLVQPSHVAQWLHLTPSALSQTLKLLEEKGFIERKRSKEDSRSVSLELTEKGVELAHKGAAERDTFMNELIEYLGEEEVKQLIVSFNKILDFMGQRCPLSSSAEESTCG